MNWRLTSFCTPLLGVTVPVLGCDENVALVDVIRDCQQAFSLGDRQEYVVRSSRLAFQILSRKQGVHPKVHANTCPIRVRRRHGMNWQPEWGGGFQLFARIFV